jgi:hypothetical protein
MRCGSYIRSQRITPLWRGGIQPNRARRRSAGAALEGSELSANPGTALAFDRAGRP